MTHKFTRKREMTPIGKPTKSGIVLMCPFCKPSHAVVPGRDNSCGVVLDVKAIQPVIGARSVRIEKIFCVKCGKSGGEMLYYFNGYVHLKNCTPGTRLLTEMPEYSRMAAFVYNLPAQVRSWLEKRMGIVQMVKEITPEGVETGEAQGYFFLKKAKA